MASGGGVDLHNSFHCSIRLAGRGLAERGRDRDGEGWREGWREGGEREGGEREREERERGREREREIFLEF